MGTIIALAGLSGAGKSTAIRILLEKAAFERVYIGAFVTDEVRLRGLPPGADSERAVRLKLREEGGPAAIFELAKPHLRRCIEAQKQILLDALFGPQERDALIEFCNGLTIAPIVLAIDATFVTRANRLAKRTERPFTEDELRIRDDTELHQLKTGEVIRSADEKINNDGTLEELDYLINLFLEKYDLI